MTADDRDAPSCGRFEGREHVLPVRIYYEDTDFTGVVYHANYLRYFARGRSDALRAAGVSHTDLLGDERPSAFTVVRMEIDFRRPARLGDGLWHKLQEDLALLEAAGEPFDREIPCSKK